jgi:HTH-like domain
VSPARRRQAVIKAMTAFKVSERRACRALGVPRSSQRYVGAEREREEELLLRIRALARENPRYGYRRIKALLVREGRSVNLKRVHRLWRREGLKVPQVQRERRRLGQSENGCARRRSERPDHVWSYEIVHSQVTKPAGLAGRPDREHITDLDIVPGHHDPVDEQLDQLPPPLKRRRVETASYPVGECSGRVHQPAQLGRPARFARERFLLFGQCTIAAFQFFPPALVLAQHEDPAQVRVGEPLDLLGHARPPTAQILPASLQFLRQPAPSGRPLQGLRHAIRLLQQVDQV